MFFEITQGLKEFREISITKSKQIQQTEVGFSNEYLLMLQICNHYTMNTEEKIPNDVAEKLNLLEKEFLTNPSNMEIINKMDSLQQVKLNISTTVDRIEKKYKVVKETSEFTKNEDSGNEIVYKITYKDNIYSLTREDVAALSYLLYIKSYPEDEFDYYNRESLQNLLSYDGLTKIVEALDDNKNAKIETLKNINADISDFKTTLQEINTIKENIQYMKNFDYKKSYNSEWSRWGDHLKKIESIQQSKYSNLLISEDDWVFINKQKDKLDKNIALKKSLRYETDEILDDLAIKNFTKYLLRDDQNYNVQLLNELDKIISSNKHANKKTKYGLTRSELTMMRLLRALDPSIDKDESLAKSLTLKQREYINQFVENSLGNMKLNKKLRKISNSSKWRKKIKKTERYDILKPIGNLEKFTFKTRRVKKYNSIARKFIKNYSGGKTLKLNLQDYALLSDINKLYNSLPLPKHIYKDNETLSVLFNRAAQAAPGMKKINNTFHKHLTNDIMFRLEDDKKSSIIKGVKMTFWQKLVRRFVTNRNHAAVVYREKDNSPFTESHMYYDEVRENQFNLGTFLYSDMYKLKLDALIDEKNQQKLESFYKNLTNSEQDGIDWKEYITDKYIKIQRRIHDQVGNIAEYDSSKESQDNTGITRLESNKDRFRRIDMPGTFSFLIYRGLFSKFRSKKSKKTDFKQIRDRMLGNFYSSKSNNKGTASMICSEFVAHSTIAALVELNEQLQRETGIDEDIIKMPISKNEDLQRLNPEQFVEVLQENNCLEVAVNTSDYLYNMKREQPGQ